MTANNAGATLCSCITRATHVGARKFMMLRQCARRKVTTGCKQIRRAAVGRLCALGKRVNRSALFHGVRYAPAALCNQGASDKRKT
jgi:hypothetical protein